jgi:hypothetical protein
MSFQFPFGRTHYHLDARLRALTEVDVDGLRLEAGSVLPEKWCDEHLEQIGELLEAGAIDVVRR